MASELKKTSRKKYSPKRVVSYVNDSAGAQLDLIYNIRKGVKKSDWKAFIEEIDCTEKELEGILPSSISSMQKRDIYDKETSERIYELARLFGIGYEIFDSKDDFNTWMRTPSKALEDRLPFELLDSSFGFELVQNELYRIQYNVYS